MSTQAVTEPAGLRASDAERERHAELLGEHAAQGRLSVDELTERLERAYSARTRAELAELLDDLPQMPAPARATKTAIAKRRELRDHVASFVLVNLLLIAIWALTGADYFWPVWPLLGWGIGVASHASEALGGRRLIGMGCHGRRSGARAA